MSEAKKVILEPAAQKFADDNAKPPFLSDLGPEKGRDTVDDVQSGEVEKPEVLITDLDIPGGPNGPVSVRVIRPVHAPATLPVIVYIHGAGWVFGNKHTHDRLIREISIGAQAAVVFPNYSLSPESKYPTAIEEIYAVVKWVAEEGTEQGFDINSLVVAGDSVGGNMTAAITLMCKERKGPKINKQLLFYPVTDASFNTDSYHQFAEGYFLQRDGMKWFWEQYTDDPKDREQITASPLRATIEQLRDLPEALIITGEADVLRDEGEAYANKLREAGVTVTAVRFQGIIHDFVMLNALADTNAKKAALKLTTTWIREGF
ncbi:alpha/beta hydrolase [Paenibacillus antarcticus]|uniref:Esterase n=1 Tax=Paenibacillus antarcticus TaxID=253703 RepID=A0A168JTV6_9BACL|nr:alpha/beta hydrolase [Paenibacillus antarcticus]OAB41096.1 esterase [Paenibacillus antarcticus]